MRGWPDAWQATKVAGHEGSCRAIGRDSEMQLSTYLPSKTIEGRITQRCAIFHLACRLPGIAVIGFAGLFLATNLTAADKTRSSKTVNATPPNYSKKTYVYKTVGACQIEADVYRLAEERVRPVILWVHGGALIMGNRGGLNTQQLQRYL